MMIVLTQTWVREECVPGRHVTDLETTCTHSQLLPHAPPLLDLACTKLTAVVKGQDQQSSSLWAKVPLGRDHRPALEKLLDRQVLRSGWVGPVRQGCQETQQLVAGTRGHRGELRVTSIPYGCWFESLLFHFQSSFLLMHLGEQGMTA